ncbi:alginate export family protein [bacterium]|nr:alginate export family protein [bacterium]MBU1883715.1 alginate export family protein [bacterium]
MKKVLLSVAAVPFLLGGLSIDVQAEDGFNILSDVKFSGEIRPRYEYVDIKNNGADAGNAFTTRTSLGVNANLFEINALSTYLEVTSVNNFGYDNYNSTANSKTQYDTIVDPQQARVTQAYVDYSIKKTLIRAGRQDVNLDNQRFIGTVNWRQMKQTYDAVAVVDNSVENLSLLGAYVYGYQTVKDLPTTDTASVLLHASYKVKEELTVTAYDYMLASISDTYGIALTGKIDADKVKLDYRAEFAKQSDPTLEYQVKNVKADAQYYNLDLGANISGILAGVNYESLGKAEGSATKGFYTPLATLHAFNGWADVFLASTNASGLTDANVRLGYTAKGFGKILGVYHKFDAQTGTNKDLGSELDAIYSNAIPGVNNLSGLVKYASYSKGDAGNDKSVAWLMLDYKFATK